MLPRGRLGEGFEYFSGEWLVLPTQHEHRLGHKLRTRAAVISEKGPRTHLCPASAEDNSLILDPSLHEWLSLWAIKFRRTQLGVVSNFHLLFVQCPLNDVDRQIPVVSLGI